MFNEEKQAIKDLDARIKNISSKEEVKEQKKSGLDLGIRVFSDLLAGIIVGLGLGYFFDDMFDTKPVLLVVFLVLGVLASFLNVYRTVSTYTDKDEQDLDKQNNIRKEK